MECDICLNPEGEIKSFYCEQPSRNKTELRKVCDKCIKRLVSNYFSISKTGSW